MNNTTYIILFVIILSILLFLCAFFSSMEVAFVSTKKYQWESSKYSSKNKFINKIITKMINSFQISIATALIGCTTVNIVASAYVSAFVVREFNASWSIAVSTAILTLVVLIFCEYIPKNIAKKNPTKYLYFLSFPAYFFWLLFWPLSRSFQFLVKKDKTKTASEKEIAHLIKTVESEGVLEKDEADLLKNALDFDEKKVNDIFQKKFVSIPFNASFDDIIKMYKKNIYSRIPVIKKDKTIGILYYSDFLNWSLENKNKNEFNITKIMNKNILSSNGDIPLDDALRLFQKKSIHILIVVDKKQKTLGILTLEMLLEELVGQLFDEKEKPKRKKQSKQIKKS